MAKHIVTDPAGVKHTIYAPEDASPEEVVAYARNTIPQAQTSKWESLGRGALQGVTFGLSDEIHGLGAGVYDKLFGDGDFSGTYARDRDAVRTANARAQEANPGTYFAGELAGGIALPGAAAKLGYRGVQAANATLKARSLAAAKEGAAYGGAYGFGKGEGDVGDQAFSTGTGALGGGVIGGAIPGAIQLAGGALGVPKQAWRVVNDPARVAAEKYAEAAARDAGSELVPTAGVTPIAQQVQRLAGNANRGEREMMLADVGGENTHNLIRAATNMPNARAERFKQVLDRRQATQPARLERSLSNNLAEGDKYFATVDDIVAKRDAIADPMFKAAFAIETPMTPQLSRVLQRPTMKKLMEHVNRSLADEDKPIGLMTRSELLHRMKLELDTQIGMSKQAEKMGNRPPAGFDTRTMTILKNDLLNAIDNKAYKYALQKYAGPSALKNAAEDGFDDALKIAPEQISGKLSQMTESEREMWRLGASRSIMGKIRSGNYLRDRTKSIFDTPDMNMRLKSIFPDGKSRSAFLKDVASERRMSATRHAAQGNSTTAKQLAHGIEAGKSIGLATDAAHAATGRVGSIVRLLERGANFASGITPRVAAEILDLGMTKSGGSALGETSRAIQNAFARGLSRKRRQGLLGDLLLPAPGILSADFAIPQRSGQR